MTPAEWRRAKEIMLEAVERDPSERGAYIRQECADDMQLRRRVEALVAADESAGALLDTPVARLAAEWGETEPSAGRRIGPYQILREIGHGGMGTVYLAERADGEYRKRVAIKLVNPHLGAADVLRRFRHERQVVAELDHPNIARLLDGGATGDGPPYLVMEYVDGERIDTWCDSHKLSVRERLKLVRSVCAAVQYAHDKQVIHRDIKPANILVTADGTPKLLDFGIAKVVNPELLAQTIETTTIGPGPMTPEYASPEQVRGEKVGPASDIYALGVVLYHLLTGRPPYSFPSTDFRQMAQVICEQEPEKPSAAARSRELAGDLDNIVLQALRKEPERRYNSAAQFSDDLDRYVQDLPVRARGDTLAYRGHKFLKRNRAPILAVALAVTTVLVLALAVGWRQLDQNKLDAYKFPLDKPSIAVLPFSDMSPEKNQEYFSEGIVEELLNTLGAIPGLRVTGRTSSSQFKGKAEGLPAIGKKLNVAAIVEGSTHKQANRARIDVRMIRSKDGFQLWSQTFDREMHHIPAVKEEIARAVAQSLKLRFPRDQTAGKTRNAQAYDNYLLGRYLLNLRKKDALRRAADAFEQATLQDSHYADAWASLAAAQISQATSNYATAEAGFRKAREALERALLLDPDLANAHLYMGTIKAFYDLDFAGADASYRRAFAKAPGNVTIIRSTAAMAGSLGRLDDAIALWHQAIEADPFHAASHYFLGFFLHYDAGKQEEAKVAFTEALKMVPGMARAHWMLARVYLEQSRPREALAEAEKEQDPGFQLVGLALAYHALGREKKSDRYLGELVTKFPVANCYQIAEVCAFRGEKDRAFEWLNRAYGARDAGVNQIKGDPLLKNIERDPRYTAILKQLHL